MINDQCSTIHRMPDLLPSRPSPQGATMAEDTHAGAGAQGSSRRRFLRALGLGALAAPAFVPLTGAHAAAPAGVANGAVPRLPLIKPPRLRRGATIGLVCPASALDGPRLMN